MDRLIQLNLRKQKITANGSDDDDEDVSDESNINSATRNFQVRMLKQFLLTIDEQEADRKI